MSNPYRHLPDRCFWSRSVAQPAHWQIDPVVRAMQISKTEKIATMGSCFAQHLSRHIESSGLNYYVAEDAPPGLPHGEARRLGYRTYSARYGNIYTVQQAVQLFHRAFGTFVPRESAWQRADRWVDPFRPQIEPDAFESKQDVQSAARTHLAFVREVFEQSDWLVFTLGLTEAWRSKEDGAVYPSAPGVAGGTFDPERHEFVNFSAAEVRDDLFEFIRLARSVKPGLKFLITVSPVPLIATYEPRHVLVSTAYSKAALRVAADVAERAFENVIYFPSYEIITAPPTAGRYYDDDMRNVRDAGVRHVMRIFSRHFIDGADTPVDTAARTSPPALSSNEDRDIVCDEIAIERSLT